MNIVAKFSHELGIWTIVTTHSPTVIRRIPKEHLTLLIRNQGPASCVPNATKLDVALLLGGGVAYRGVILVEDEAAKRFVLSIIEKLEPEMLRQFEVVIAGSASNITTVLKSMPLTRSWLTLVGVYDGDVRTTVAGTDFKWPFGFLPGDVAPDQLLKALSGNTPNIAEALSAELGKSADQVSMALNHVAGVDHHDYLTEFAVALNIDASIVHRGFARIWLQEQGNATSALNFIEQVRNAAKLG